MLPRISAAAIVLLEINGCARHYRFPLNIAGNSQHSLEDRSRFLDFDRGDVVAEAKTEYIAKIEYEYRDAEYEYDRDKIIS